MSSDSHWKWKFKSAISASRSVAMLLAAPEIERRCRDGGHAWRRSFWSPTTTGPGVPVPGAQRSQDAAGWRRRHPRRPCLGRHGRGVHASIGRSQRLLSSAPAPAVGGDRGHARRGDRAGDGPRRHRQAVARTTRARRGRVQREHARRAGAPGGVPSAIRTTEGVRLSRHAPAGGVLLGRRSAVEDLHELAA